MAPVDSPEVSSDGLDGCVVGICVVYCAAVNVDVVLTGGRDTVDVDVAVVVVIAAAVVDAA